MAGTADVQNKIMAVTKADVEELAPRKHPKALYVECLKNATEWHSYAASPTFSVADMAMYACKNIGCALNFCSLQKMGSVMDWEGSSDCM